MTLVPRRWLVEKLVWESHLNVQERQMLGSASVKRSEIRDIIKGYLDADGSFPPVKPSSAGEAFAYEGYILQKTSSGKFKLIGQENSAYGISHGHDAKGEFADADTAINELIKRQYGADIDGIAIEMD